MTSTLNCCSRSLLARAGSIVDADRGGNWGHTGEAPLPHTDMIASCDMDFQRASSRRLNWHTSMLSVG
ncbi:hypothetical protein DPMN_178600 [Dreissena polymorpha]|uniref:Uncharacterized protein n=1 Tax=Dreissena polymorpha TaxID=45954 RepID=A0A9D4ED76_DREPO|nr:hypothetical protein DPMN_178600 [Dreissena polymorpha]